MSSPRIININDPEYKRKRSIAKEAYQKGHWVFNSREQQWYTPEEFMAIKRKLGVELEDCQICDPRLALKSRVGMLESKLRDLNNMIAKIESYYSYEPRRKGK